MQRQHFDIVKRNPFDKARAQYLHDGFFGSPAACKSDGRVSVFIGVRNFIDREAAIQERVAMPFNHPPDTSDFDNICSNANYHLTNPGPLQLQT